MNGWVKSTLIKGVLSEMMFTSLLTVLKGNIKKYC